MNRYRLVIFVTGGITLALELLASRILTPYFGVSLYIWSGILSITLIALAVGYWWGGRLAAHASRDQEPRLTGLFALMPAVSSLSILAATLLYPTIFVALARFSVVFGSFIACLLLLFVPLVTISAMNPLLVALTTSRSEDSTRAGDAGAGYVFFISTVGSVLGVLVTAFLLVPYITNFRALLILAIALAATTLLLAQREPRLAAQHRLGLSGLAIFAGLAAMVLFAFADTYLGKDQTLTHGSQTFRLVFEKPTFFGNIKVVDAFPRRGGPAEKKRGYLVDGLAQCVIRGDGQPGSVYTYGMEAVGRGLVPNPRTILVLGLGGGTLPKRFANRDVQIDVVEINPVSIPIAQQFFAYDPTVAQHYLEDARVFVRHCQKKYDLVFADLFHGDSTPEYLLSAEFMSDLSRCVTPRGGVVFNMVGHTDDRFREALYSYAKTVGVAWPHLRLFHPSTNKGICNLMLLASASPLETHTPAAIPVPEAMQASVRELLTPQPLDRDRLANAVLLTDEHNVASLQQAWCFLQSRIPVIESQPAALLVN